MSISCYTRNYLITDYCLSGKKYIQPALGIESQKDFESEVYLKIK